MKFSITYEDFKWKYLWLRNSYNHNTKSVQTTQVSINRKTEQIPGLSVTEHYAVRKDYAANKAQLQSMIDQLVAEPALASDAPDSWCRALCTYYNGPSLVPVESWDSTPANTAPSAQPAFPWHVNTFLLGGALTNFWPHKYIFSSLEWKCKARRFAEKSIFALSWERGKIVRELQYFLLL